MALESLQFIRLQVTNEVGSSLEGNILQNQMQLFNRVPQESWMEKKDSKISVEVEKYGRGT